MSSSPQKYSLGIDIGGTSVKVAVLHPSGVATTGASPPYARPAVTALSQAITFAVREARLALPSAFDPWSIATVGLCAPGVVDARTTEVLLSANLPSLIGTRLDALAHEALRTAVLDSDETADPLDALQLVQPSPREALARLSSALCVCSDALAAGVDYCFSQSPPQSGRMLALSLGTGVGGCVLDDGVQLLVNPGTSGHFGQVDVSLEPDPRQSPVGSDAGRGSLEAYIGLPALRVRFGDRLQSWLASPELSDPPIRALVRALRITHAIYRPNHIALLGGIGLALGRSSIAPLLRPAIADGLTNLARPDWTLSFAQHAFHAAAGAARLASRDSGCKR